MFDPNLIKSNGLTLPLVLQEKPVFKEEEILLGPEVKKRLQYCAREVINQLRNLLLAAQEEEINLDIEFTGSIVPRAMGLRKPSNPKLNDIDVRITPKDWSQVEVIHQFCLKIFGKTITQKEKKPFYINYEIDNFPAKVDLTILTDNPVVPEATSSFDGLKIALRIKGDGGVDLIIRQSKFISTFSPLEQSIFLIRIGKCAVSKELAEATQNGLIHHANRLANKILLFCHAEEINQIEAAYCRTFFKEYNNSTGLNAFKGKLERYISKHFDVEKSSERLKAIDFLTHIKNIIARGKLPASFYLNLSRVDHAIEEVQAHFQESFSVLEKHRQPFSHYWSLKEYLDGTSHNLPFCDEQNFIFLTQKLIQLFSIELFQLFSDHKDSENFLNNQQLIEDLEKRVKLLLENLSDNELKSQLAHVFSIYINERNAEGNRLPIIGPGLDEVAIYLTCKYPKAALENPPAIVAPPPEVGLTVEEKPQNVQIDSTFRKKYSLLQTQSLKSFLELYREKSEHSSVEKSAHLIKLLKKEKKEADSEELEKCVHALLLELQKDSKDINPLITAYFTHKVFKSMEISTYWIIDAIKKGSLLRLQTIYHAIQPLEDSNKETLLKSMYAQMMAGTIIKTEVNRQMREWLKEVFCKAKHPLFLNEYLVLLEREKAPLQIEAVVQVYPQLCEEGKNRLEEKTLLLFKKISDEECFGLYKKAEKILHEFQPLLFFQIFQVTCIQTFSTQSAEKHLTHEFLSKELDFLNAKKFIPPSNIVLGRFSTIFKKRHPDLVDKFNLLMGKPKHAKAISSIPPLGQEKIHFNKKQEKEALPKEEAEEVPLKEEVKAVSQKENLKSASKKKSRQKKIKTGKKEKALANPLEIEVTKLPIIFFDKLFNDLIDQGKYQDAANIFYELKDFPLENEKFFKNVMLMMDNLNISPIRFLEKYIEKSQFAFDTLFNDWKIYDWISKTFYSIRDMPGAYIHGAIALKKLILYGKKGAAQQRACSAIRERLVLLHSNMDRSYRLWNHAVDQIFLHLPVFGQLDLDDFTHAVKGLEEKAKTLGILLQLKDLSLPDRIIEESKLTALVKSFKQNATLQVEEEIPKAGQLTKEEIINENMRVGESYLAESFFSPLKAKKAAECFIQILNVQNNHREAFHLLLRTLKYMGDLAEDFPFIQEYILEKKSLYYLLYVGEEFNTVKENDLDVEDYRDLCKIDMHLLSIESFSLRLISISRCLNSKKLSKNQTFEYLEIFMDYLKRVNTYIKNKNTNERTIFEVNLSFFFEIKNFFDVLNFNETYTQLIILLNDLCRDYYIKLEVGKKTDLATLYYEISLNNSYIIALFYLKDYQQAFSLLMKNYYSLSKIENILDDQGKDLLIQLINLWIFFASKTNYEDIPQSSKFIEQTSLLFERALDISKGDIKVWVNYIKFLHRGNYKKVILHLHPRFYNHFHQLRLFSASSHLLVGQVFEEFAQLILEEDQNDSLEVYEGLDMYSRMRYMAYLQYALALESQLPLASNPDNSDQSNRLVSKKEIYYCLNSFFDKFKLEGLFSLPQEKSKESLCLQLINKIHDEGIKIARAEIYENKQLGIENPSRLSLLIDQLSVLLYHSYDQSIKPSREFKDELSEMQKIDAFLYLGEKCKDLGEKSFKAHEQAVSCFSYVLEQCPNHRIAFCYLLETSCQLKTFENLVLGYQELTYEEVSKYFRKYEAAGGESLDRENYNALIDIYEKLENWPHVFFIGLKSLHISLSNPDISLTQAVEEISIFAKLLNKIEENLKSKNLANYTLIETQILLWIKNVLSFKEMVTLYKKSRLDLVDILNNLLKEKETEYPDYYSMNDRKKEVQIERVLKMNKLDSLSSITSNGKQYLESEESLLNMYRAVQEMDAQDCAKNMEVLNYQGLLNDLIDGIYKFSSTISKEEKLYFEKKIFILFYKALSVGDNSDIFSRCIDYLHFFDRNYAILKVYDKFRIKKNKPWLGNPLMHLKIAKAYIELKNMSPSDFHFENSTIALPFDLHMITLSYLQLSMANYQIIYHPCKKEIDRERVLEAKKHELNQQEFLFSKLKPEFAKFLFGKEPDNQTSYSKMIYEKILCLQEEIGKALQNEENIFFNVLNELLSIFYPRVVNL